MGKRLFTALALLVPALSFGQGVTYRQRPAIGDVSGPRTALQLPFTATGALIPEDSGTVSHVYWLQPRTNLVTASEQFNNALWNKVGVTSAAPTVTADQATAPDGSLTADKVDFASVAGSAQRSILYQSVATSPGSRSFSVYVKGVSSTGTLYLSQGVSTTSYSTVACPVTLEWTRCSVGYDSAYGAATNNVIIGPDPAGEPSQPSTQPALSVYLWGAQAEAGPTATNYIQTVASAVTVSQKGNAVQFSEHFDRSPWTTYGYAGAVAPTVTPNVTTVLAPTGDIGEVERIDFNPVTNAQQSTLYAAVSGIATGQPATFSMWVRAVSGTATIHLGFTATGTTAETSCTVTSTAWTRCFHQRLPGAAVTFATFGLDGINMGGSFPAASVYVYGAMLNPGSWPDEYEVTTTTPTLRGPLVDTKGNAWTTNGSITVATSGPLYPGGFTNLPKTGAGPFSAANYYSLGSGSDVLDFAGDFTACFTFTGASTTSVLWRNGNGSTTGLSAYYTGGGIFNLISWPAGVPIAATGNLAVGSANVACVGRVGTTGYAKMNLNTTASGSVSPIALGSGNAAWLGTDGTNGSGAISEAYFTTTPWSETAVTQIQQRVLGITGTKGEVGTFTRATTATYQPVASTGQIFLAPSGVPRVSENGYLAEPSRTNLQFQSGTVSSANAFVSPWNPSNVTVVTGTAGGFLDGVGGWHSITSTTNVGYAFSAVSTGGVTQTQFVGSTWMKKASGTGYASIWTGCGAAAPSTCTCLRSDGGTCTAATKSVNYCSAEVSDLGTTPVRLSAIVTCNAGITGSSNFLVPGQYGTATGSTDFSGVQLEAGATYPTSYIPTVGTAITRNADALSYTNPLLLTNRKWCVNGTFSQNEKGSWAIGDRMLYSFGDEGGTNSSFIRHQTGTQYFRVYNNAGQAKEAATTSGFALGTAHTITTCDANGALTLSLDGLPKASPGTGAGDGLWGVKPTGFYVGYTNVTGIQSGLGTKNLKVCVNAARPSECR